MSGLFGDCDGSTTNDLVTSDGTAIAPATLESPGGFESLYGEFADWLAC